MSRTIVNIKFGSHLYGTSTPESDLDFKAVAVPSAQDILLQRARGNVGESRRPKQPGERNTPGEVEVENYSLMRYLELVAQGQTVALDMLFAPVSAMVEVPSTEWLEVTDNRHCLVSKKSAAFVGYCRQQANKYGIKGSRVAAARAALALLDSPFVSRNPLTKLGYFEEAIREVEVEFWDIVEITSASGQVIKHWEVCGRKMPFTSTVKTAREVMQRLVDEYGQRALQAERNEGVDWKALSHAVRVGYEAIELLQTGHITFPLQEAAHILDIKLGNLSYQTVSAEIEELLVAVEDAAGRSTLPAEPDHKWIEQFVYQTYKWEVLHD